MAEKISLNKTNIERIKSPEKRTVIWDKSITGFGLRVMPSGSKTFFFQGRVNRELVRITIGKYPACNPKQARDRAKIIEGDIAKGIDPRPEKKAAESATFGDLMTAYADLLERQGKQSHKAVRLQIAKHIQGEFPTLWKKNISDISMDDCMRIVRRIIDKDKPRQADKIRSYIRTAFSVAINAKSDASIPESLQRLNVQSNPARDIAKIEGSSNAKDRALTLAELRAYWKRVQELPEPAKSVATIHLLTGGQRQQQLARVKLDDIDRDDMTVSILDYKGKRKDPRVHTIPLLPEVMEAIERITGAGEYVFSCDGGKTPVSTSYMNDVIKRVRKRMEEAGEIEKGHFTAGSLRATVETRLAAKPYRVSSDVLAHLLSHGLGGVQAKHYQHHDFIEEKLEALQMLRRMVEGDAEPVADIIPFRQAK